MVWHRNEGQIEDDIIQNRFTAYLLCAVKRERAVYIDQAVREMRDREAMNDAIAIHDFDLEQEIFQNVPVFMKIQNERLYSALFQLSEREQYVFFNRVLNEKSYNELAAELGLSNKGVAAIYYRTVERIRKMMRGGKEE